MDEKLLYYANAPKRKDGAPGWCFLTVRGKLLSICQVYDIFDESMNESIILKVWISRSGGAVDSTKSKEQRVPGSGPSRRPQIDVHGLYPFVFLRAASSLKCSVGSERGSVQGLGLSQGTDCSEAIYRKRGGCGVTLEEDQTQILSVWKSDLKGSGLIFSSFFFLN